jgi:protein-disulfide isomerase
MSSTNKRTILLVLWLVILGGLYALITHVNLPGAPAQPPAPIKLPKLTAANLQAHWTEIVAHAPNAPYTMVEFGDFQCPQCGKMRPVIEKMLAQSGGKANLMFLHRPFANLHKWAMDSGEASLAAAAQGKFWPMYDALYSHQDNLEPGYYNGYAQAIGLDVSKFSAALASHQYLPALNQDVQFANSIQVEVTPTLLVRDNKTGKITIYIGADSTMPGAIPGFQGIEQLDAAPPWQASAAPAKP